MQAFGAELWLAAKWLWMILVLRSRILMRRELALWLALAWVVCLVLKNTMIFLRKKE